jgi:hypothetical protein
LITFFPSPLFILGAWLFTELNMFDFLFRLICSSILVKFLSWAYMFVTIFLPYLCLVFT